MKKSNVIAKMLALLVTLSLVLSLAACGGGTTNQPSQTEAVESGSQTQSAQSVQSEKPKEPVTITCLIREVGTKWNNYPDNPVSQEIKNQTGVTFNIVEADDNKYNILIAGGDLPDMIRAQPDNFKQLIDGNLVIPLDDLLQSGGQDILKNVPATIDYSKKFWSGDTNKLYFLPSNVGHDAIGFQLGIGICLRWDYYKELAYPEIKSEDDLLGILAQMQKLHPTADNGKKVYGVGMFNDGGTWPLIYPMASIYGYRGVGSGVYASKSDTNEIVCEVMDMNAPIWKAITFYYKANKMGLLDPDSFTMKYNDLAAKCNNGQILYQTGLWSGDLNNKLSKDGKGYMAIPTDVGFQWCGAYYTSGWADKAYAITKSCKNPERAMDLMNYLWSYDGSRTLRSGVKGVHWDVVNDKPQLKDDVIALKSTGGDEWDKTGIDLLINFTGLSEFEVNPADNTPVNLFDTAQVYTTMMNPLYKDFCDHYGVTYPAEAFYKKLDEGKNFNEKNMNPLISAALATAPDDIARIDAKLLDIITKGSAKCILSKSDADFEANKKAVLDELKAAGVDQSIEWNTKAWADAKTAVGAK